jgi:hypothetical protein
MSPTRYRKLDSRQIVETLSSLRTRIDGRFPASGLGRVCEELLEIGQDAARFTDSQRRPIYPVRVVSWALIGFIILLAGLGVAAVVGLARSGGSQAFGSLGEIVEAVEATLNELVLLGLAVVFLATAEGRIKRRRALRALRELRSIAHVVDMHQLSKDPKDLLAGEDGGDEGDLEVIGREDLAHYLDYCSELLSHTSKLAALYLEGFGDHVVIGAVNEIEALAAGLSGKIWQKIMILDRLPTGP